MYIRNLIILPLLSFRAHSFKKRIEKSDEELKKYIKSLTVFIEEPVRSEMRAPEMKQPSIHQETQGPLIINMGPLSNPMINQNQLFQTASGQICQLIQGPNNTIQMINTLPQAQAQPPQLIQHPEESFFEVPVVLQSANGQQTILNLPTHQLQALQQQIATSNQHQQLQEIVQEADEIEIQEYEDFTCEEMEEVNEDEEDQFVQIVQAEELEEEISDTEDKQQLAEFLAQQTQSFPGRHICNLCNQEFKHQKWLHSHFRTIHQNWIKANCKKMPSCHRCGKSFRGPGMLKMHMKTHEKENKLPSCTICGKEFKSKSILYRHRSTHFSNQKLHRCEICDKNFSSNYQLSAHLQRHQKHETTKVKN